MYSTLIGGKPSHAYRTVFLVTDAACGNRIVMSAAELIVGSKHSTAVRKLLFIVHISPAG
jgi:hypothetical protein